MGNLLSKKSSNIEKKIEDENPIALWYDGKIKKIKGIKVKNKQIKQIKSHNQPQ